MWAPHNNLSAGGFFAPTTQTNHFGIPLAKIKLWNRAVVHSVVKNDGQIDFSGHCSLFNDDGRKYDLNRRLPQIKTDSRRFRSHLEMDRSILNRKQTIGTKPLMFWCFRKGRSRPTVRVLTLTPCLSVAQFTTDRAVISKCSTIFFRKNLHFVFLLFRKIENLHNRRSRDPSPVGKSSPMGKTKFVPSSQCRYCRMFHQLIYISILEFQENRETHFLEIF